MEERNRIAKQIIEQYVTTHAAMDVGIGLIGFIPGAAIPALLTAIGLQAPVIYQPMAQKLARIYLASPQELDDAESDIVLPDALAYTAGLDMAADFGLRFIMRIASDLVLDAGLGSLAALIPVAGGFVSAGLDYVIATTMTRRVGIMVSIYFQNGARWIEDKERTYEESKRISDLNEIRGRLTPVRESLVRNVKSYVDVMREGMTADQIRGILGAKGIPDDLIAEALAG